MHTDDIFESLSIDDGSNNADGAAGRQSGGTADYLDDRDSSDASSAAKNTHAEDTTHADASDDIFEDLDMEEKIYQTAITSGNNGSGGAHSAYSGSGAKSDSRSTGSVRRAGGMGTGDAAIGRGNNASHGRNAGRQGDFASAAGTAAYSGGGRGGSSGDGGNAQGHGTRRSPRELNTADTSLDRRKYTKDKEKRKKSKIRKIIICSVVELFTLAAIFIYGYLLKTWNMIARPEVRIEAVENNNISVEKKKEMEGYWNIAVFGVDSRGSSVVERGINSDVIMVVSINKDTGDIKIVSVFRDTYLNISEKNSYNKINQAYAIGGPEQALAALNKNLDLNIQHYVAFNWKAVADGINILGGVDNIPISKAELYYINAYITETVKVTKVGSVQLTHTGEQHLDGVQAVAYGRLRYMDNDFARTERQRNILKAAFAKAKKAGFSVLNNIMVVCFPQVATNIDFNEVIEMAQNITQYNIADTGGFPWSRGDANIGKKGDCVIPTTLESNVVKLHEFLFGDTDYTPSDAVLNISSQIKSDSGRYKEGKMIESVSTDSGVIQKPRTAAETKSSKDSEEDESESGTGSSKHGRETIGVDDDGNYIYPTDADGNIVVPTDADGKIIYPTDAEGNIIRETSAARPTELSTEDASHMPGDLDESDDPETEAGPMSTSASPGNTGHVTETTRHGSTETTAAGGGAYSPAPGDGGSTSVSPGGTNPGGSSSPDNGGAIISDEGPAALATEGSGIGPG